MSFVFPMRTSLRYRGSYTIPPSIRVQMVWLSGVDGTQMCRIDHCLLQLVEGGLMYRCPLPFAICSQHRGWRSRHSLESFDKLLVKSTQPDKLSNFMDVGRQRPTLNDLDLFRVPVYSIFIDHVSAERDWRLQER